MTDTAFVINQVLVAKSSLQGLTRDHHYRVSAINTRRTIHGLFVSYHVTPIDSGEEARLMRTTGCGGIEIKNAHIVLRPATPEEAR